MKRQITTLLILIAIACIALTMIIGACGISVSAAEEKPTISISLIGNATIYLQKGTEYHEFGATAYNAVEGDLTGSITIDHSIRIMQERISR